MALELFYSLKCTKNLLLEVNVYLFFFFCTKVKFTN